MHTKSEYVESCSCKTVLGAAGCSGHSDWMEHSQRVNMLDVSTAMCVFVCVCVSVRVARIESRQRSKVIATKRGSRILFPARAMYVLPPLLCPLTFLLISAGSKMAVALPLVDLPSVLNLRIHDTSDTFHPPTPPRSHAPTHPSLEHVVLSKGTAS
jgi:hypothetical protein